MPDCRKSHQIFQNFLGEAPRPAAGARAFDARFGASPAYRAPLYKIPGSAPAEVLTKSTKRRKIFLFAKASEDN